MVTAALPPIPLNPEMSAIAATSLQIAALTSRLAAENRTLVNHPDGRAENVAEHSLMLSVIAPAIAETYYPQLDANLVCRFATIHDAVEAYVGDTATHNITAAGLAEKAVREAKGFEQLASDFKAAPHFVSLIRQYEAQQQPEARFVRVIDKWTPILMHFIDEGATLRAYSDPRSLLKDFEVQEARLKQQFSDFSELVAVRVELTKLAASSLFRH